MLGILSRDQAAQAIDALAKGGRAPSTVNQAVKKSLSAPFGAAMRLGYIRLNPCAGVEPLLDEVEGERETFTTRQVGALLAKAEGDWKGAILCGFYTGLRLSDVATLKWEAVDFDARVLRLKTGKTHTAVVLPLHAEFEDWLRSQPRGIAKAPIFRELAGKGTGGKFGLSGRFKALMKRAGIVARVIRESNGAGRQTTSLSYHCLRHSFVSALANAGVPSDVRQKLASHADAKSHARYTHHEVETMRAAVAMLPSVGIAG